MCRLYHIEVEAKASENGPIRGELRIQADGDKISARIPFSALVEPAIRVVPSALVLPRRGSADPYTARLQCQADASCVFFVDQLPPGLDADLKETVLTVRCRPEAFPRDGTQTVVVGARTEDGSVHRLPVKITIFRDGIETNR